MTEDNTEKQSKYTAKRLSGLKPWQPGKSGNPNGRPPNTKYISEYLREKLLDKTSIGKSHAEVIADVLIELAETQLSRAQILAIKEILDRTDGRVPETHKIESDIPIILQPVIYERDK